MAFETIGNAIAIASQHRQRLEKGAGSGRTNRRINQCRQSDSVTNVKVYELMVILSF